MANLKLNLSDKINLSQKGENLGEAKSPYLTLSELENIFSAVEEALPSPAPGSDAESCEPYLSFIDEYYQGAAVVEVGFGDLRSWGSLGPHQRFGSYLGVDVLSTRVSQATSRIAKNPQYDFVHGTLFDVEEQAQCANLIIIKDVLQHLSLFEIHHLLDFVKQLGTRCLVTNWFEPRSNQTNSECPTGFVRPINMKAFENVFIHEFLWLCPSERGSHIKQTVLI